MPDNDETMRRINRANAHAGGIAFLREDAIWDDIDGLTDVLDNDDFHWQLPYDDDPVARRIAGHMVKNHIKAWDVGRRHVYEQFCPESEATLYVMSYSGAPTYITALRSIEQLREVKEDMKGLWRCDTLVNRHCDRRNNGPNVEYPVEFLAIKRGQNICVFTACDHCLRHISSGAGVNHPDYIGPAEDWFDDRPRATVQDDNAFDS